MSTAVLERPMAPVLDPAPVDTPSPRPRLSDALREGARHHPQGVGYMYNPQTGATCALGAIMVGLLGPEAFTKEVWKETSSALIHEHTGVWTHTFRRRLRQESVLEPWYRRACSKDCTLQQAVMYLNDDEGWSREQIADWLESLGF